MATKQAPLPEPGTPEAAAAQPAADDGTQAEVVISQWEFVDRVPTREDVVALLETLPPVWGVKTVDFADYVQALPQRKKVKRPHETNPNVMVDVHIDCYTLYVSVAGRLKMLEAAAEKNGWQVDFQPEEFTPTGVPGFVSLEPRIVYREYVVIHAPTQAFRVVDGADRPQVVIDKKTTLDQMLRPLGRKPGTAWVPATGGSNAAGSNPYEKVETSASGRAIAAWGFGVLPGSGVASVEEIQGARQNKSWMDAESAAPQGAQGRRGTGGGRPPRQTLIEKALSLKEEIRQYRGQTEEEAITQLGRYLANSLGVTAAWNEETQTLDWGPVKDGQIELTVNALQDTVRRFVGQEHGL